MVVARAGADLLSSEAARSAAGNPGSGEVRLAAGAVRLMSNGICANQGLRIGRTTYGFQFHFEVTKADAVNFPRDCWASMERHYGDLAELVAADVIRSVAAHFAEGAAFCRTVTRRWLDLVIERRAWAERPHRVRRRA